MTIVRIVTPACPTLGTSGRPLSGISFASSVSSTVKGDNRSSLSINYLPSKFSAPHAPGVSFRKANDPSKAGLVKRGGGREAFADGAARMPGAGDNDYDGVAVDGWFTADGKAKKGKLHWNRFKLVLFFTNTLLTAWTLLALIACIVTWFNIWDHADIVRVGNGLILMLSTVAASVGVFTAMIGWAGILLNNRAFLSVYSLFLWVTFGLLVAPGYIAYRRSALNLERKVNFQWSRTLGVIGRLRIQNELQCCGYYSPFVEATISQTCYARSNLPGCKGPYLRFQEFLLVRWYIASFALVPVQLLCIYASLLCGNHVTYRFGKGMMPKRYRLNQESMVAIMENYTNQLAETYGEDVARDVVARSQSNLNLGDTLSGSSHGGGNAGGGRPSSSWSGAPSIAGGSPYGHRGGPEGKRM